MVHRVLALAGAMALAAGVVVAQPSNDTPKKPADPAKRTEPGKKEEKQGGLLKAGSKAPALTVEKWVKGQPVTGLEKGRVYVVEFWATWCPPCIESIPHLTELQHKYKDVTFIGVAASERKAKDGNDKRLATVEKFVKDQGDKMDYRVAFDPDRKMSKTWMEAARQDGIPTAFLVDKEGKIAWIGHPSQLEGELAKIAKPSGEKTEKPKAKPGR